MSAGMRGRLAAALHPAMRARDAAAVSALRSALAAIGNAEAVPVDSVPRAGAVEHALVGHGAADVPRRELTEAEVHEVVEGEVASRLSAAEHLEEAGRPDEGARLRAEAAVLRGHLDD
jgi:uncharacterized protein YqeY